MGRAKTVLSLDVSRVLSPYTVAIPVRMVKMIDHERARRLSEQRLVLWAWLHDGHLPVAHLVAEVDDPRDAEAIVPRRDCSQPLDNLDWLDTLALGHN